LSGAAICARPLVNFGQYGLNDGLNFGFLHRDNPFKLLDPFLVPVTFLAAKFLCMTQPVKLNS
jgi:hypothetical protein